MIQFYNIYRRTDAIISQIMTDSIQNNTSESLYDEQTEIVQTKASENLLLMATNIERVPLNSLKR